MNPKWKGFSSTIRIENAKEILLSHLRSINDIEEISVLLSFNRKLAEKINAPNSLPGFRRSAMDGYAVKSNNTFGASDTNPVQLNISGKVEIGDTEILTLDNGNAIKISTGAPLPLNADAVIKIEDCEELDDMTLELYSSVAIGKNVANEDEDVKQGEVIFDVDHVLLPWDISLLISLGIKRINVFRKPRIAVLSTGSELVSTEQTPIIGQVFDSIRPVIEIWCDHLGAEVYFTDTCKDEKDIISDKLLEINNNVDLIITTGGTSVGTRDYMSEIIKNIGEIWVKGISMRPGKPVIIGEIESTLIIALPGYPLAAFLNFDLFVVYTLKFWTGLPSFWEKEKTIVLNHSVASRSGIRDMVRLRETKDGVNLLRITGAGILSSLTKADYLLEIPEDLEGYPEGSEVKVRELRK